VVQRQTGRSIRAELRLDFRCELPAHIRPEKHCDANPYEIAAQPRLRVDQIRNAFWGKHRRAIDEHQMQTDPKRRQTARASDRIASRRAVHHQACRREDAVGVRELDAFIDLRCQAEIVGRDDQALWISQCAVSRRSRRK